MQIFDLMSEKLLLDKLLLGLFLGRGLYPTLNILQLNVVICLELRSARAFPFPCYHAHWNYYHSLLLRQTWCWIFMVIALVIYLGERKTQSQLHVLLAFAGFCLLFLKPRCRLCMYQLQVDTTLYLFSMLDNNNNNNKNVSFYNSLFLLQ